MRDGHLTSVGWGHVWLSVRRRVYWRDSPGRLSPPYLPTPELLWFPSRKGTAGQCTICPALITLLTWWHCTNYHSQLEKKRISYTVFFPCSQDLPPFLSHPPLSLQCLYLIQGNMLSGRDIWNKASFTWLLGSIWSCWKQVNPSPTW